MGTLQNTNLLLSLNLRAAVTLCTLLLGAATDTAADTGENQEERDGNFLKY